MLWSTTGRQLIKRLPGPTLTEPAVGELEHDTMQAQAGPDSHSVDLILTRSSTLLESPASFLLMLTRKPLPCLLLEFGFSSVGSGQSGKSIQFCMRSAKLLSPRTSGWRLRPLVNKELVQSSGSLTSNDVHLSRQASDVDLGRMRPLGALLVRRHAEDDTRTFRVLLRTTTSSCHDASEYPESNSKLF
ncbi:hypothetical protein EYF80_031788 [Liparis tanakae]|uniref:Uncharacterized protein n=1 Tax=Liparis tanakae TaxID=230148 RepID=A0A4Z2GZD9_9TELE|nr:hypothetical protein EYF80_031788 [Liparis tanakae]